MAKSDGIEYKNRQRTFAKALDEILDDNEKIYYARLCAYFESCLADETDPEKATEYTAAIEKLKSTQKMSDTEIGLIFGVNRTTAMRWHSFHRDKMKLPPLDNIIKLAEIFDVTTDYILGYEELPKRELQAEYAPFKEMGIDITAYNNLIAAKSTDPIVYNRLMSALNAVLSNTELLYNGRPIAPEDAKDVETVLSFPVLRGIAEYLDTPTDKYMIASMDDVTALIEKGVADSENKYADLSAHVFKTFSMPSPDILEAYKLSNLTQAVKELKSDRLIAWGKSLGIDWPQK